MFKFSVILLVSALPGTLGLTQHIAMAPAAQMKGTQGLEWATLTFAANVTSAADVTLTSATASDFDLSGVYMSDAAQLTGRVNGGYYYALTNTGVAPSESGCCADTLRRHSGDGTSLDIDLTFIAGLFEDTDWAYATHTFDVYDGIAYMMVQYEEPALGSEVKVDAIVAMDLATEEVVKTADGLSYFSLYDNLETTSVESSAGVFKIQHYSKSGRLQPGPGPSSVEEWHGNGVTKFVGSDGSPYLALTHRSLNECFVLTDPWELAGGGEIVQRYGAPAIYTAAGEKDGNHVFGMGSEVDGGSWNGVHNAQYRNGKIGIFVNSDGDGSAVHEFEFKPVFEKDVVGEVGDEVFDVEWTGVSMPFVTPAQGGARAIADGVYVVAGGASNTGLWVVSADGEYKNYEGQGVSVYDSFSFVEA